MFLATSLKRSTSTNFALHIAGTNSIPNVCGPRKRVLFEIIFSSSRCMHANYIGPDETQVWDPSHTGSLCWEECP